MGIYLGSCSSDSCIQFSFSYNWKTVSTGQGAQPLFLKVQTLEKFYPISTVKFSDKLSPWKPALASHYHHFFKTSCSFLYSLGHFHSRNRDYGNLWFELFSYDCLNLYFLFLLRFLILLTVSFFLTFLLFFHLIFPIGQSIP